MLPKNVSLGDFNFRLKSDRMTRTTGSLPKHSLKSARKLSLHGEMGLFTNNAETEINS